MAAFEKVVNTPADSGNGTNNQLSWGIQNRNWDLAEQLLGEKANALQTSQSLEALQTALAAKAGQDSVDNLTQRVQENALAINDVRNAATPAALAGDGLIANAGKIDVNPGDGLVLDSGQVMVDPDLLNAIHGAASQQQVSQLAGKVDLQQAAINNLQEQVVTAADLAGPGLQAQDGKLTPNIGAGLEVSTDNQLQISPDLAQTINGKATEEALQAVAGIVGNNVAAIIALQSAITDLQNDTARISAVNYEVGTYALVGNTSTTITASANTVVSGSILVSVGPVIYSTGATTPSMGISNVLTGSWRVMGYGLGARTGNAYMIGIAKRVA